MFCSFSGPVSVAFSGTHDARRGIALLALSTKCESLANRNELIYKVYTMRELLEVQLYSRNATVVAA